MQRELLTRAIIAGVLVALVFAGTLYLPSQQQAPYMDTYDGHAMHVELYVYKNGKLIYYDPDDPALKNLIGVFYWLFTGADDFVFTTRNNYKDAFLNDGVYVNKFGKAIIAVANGTATFTREMYILPGTELRAVIADSGVSFGVNYIQISGTININQSINITWVGLYSSLDDNEDLSINDVLLFADPLDQPIQVNAGDVVTVVYKLVLP